MKKSKKIILTLMAFGLAVSLYACGANKPDSSDSGGGNLSDASSTSDSSVDSSTASDSSSDSQTSDSSSASVEPDEPVDVGVFAEQIWVGKDGTLDFAAGTLTGTTEFKVTGVSGEKAETEISVTADGSDYIFKLNAAGALEMYASTVTVEEGSAPLKIFIADASAFGGAWKSSDEYAMVYYAIDSSVNSDGVFAWEQYTTYSDEAVEMDGTATTRFGFDENGESSVSFEMLSYGYSHAVVSYNDEGTLQIADDWGTYSFLPYADCFGASASYLTEKGDKLIFNGEAGTISYNGQSATYETVAEKYGSGLKFTIEEKDYLLQRRFGGTFITSADGAAICADYDPERIKGAWSSSSGTYTVSVVTDDKIVFNGTEYPLKAYVKDGETRYDFTVNGVLYTVRTIDGVDAAFLLETEAIRHKGYYVLDEVKKSYVAEYTNNMETFVVDENYYIKITSLLADDEEPATYQGTFTYDPDLQCVALVYGGNALTQKNYLVLVDEAGIYWSVVKTGSAYSVYASYFTHGAVAAAEELFESGLEDADSDFYTTGGVSPESLSFDFENGTVIRGEKSYRFMWNCESDSFGNTYPSIVYLTNIEEDSDGNLSYDYHSICVSGLGLYMIAYNTKTPEETEYDYFISDSVYQEILGFEFVHRGKYYDEKVILNKDGSFEVATTDKTDSDSAVSMVKYPYLLQRTFNEETQTEDIAVIFGTSGTASETGWNIYVHIINREYATIFDLVYSDAQLVEYVGTYYAGADTVELTENGQIKVNGIPAVVTKTTKSDSSVTITYTHMAANYTAEFSDGKVVVTPADGASTTYDENKSTPEAFVGTYTLGGKTIVVSSSATGVNYELSLKVTVDGTSATATLAFTAEGKQRLSFSVFDFSTLETTNYTITLDGETLKLSDGTNTAECAAAKWDYSDFVLEETKTLTDSVGATHTLICLPKNGGRTPLFLYDGAEMSSYSVTIAADGSMTLEIVCTSATLQIKVSSDGVVTADYKPSDVPVIPSIPSVPPAPPAPEL